MFLFPFCTNTLKTQNCLLTGAASAGAKEADPLAFALETEVEFPGVS